MGLSLARLANLIDDCFIMVLCLGIVELNKNLNIQVEKLMSFLTSKLPLIIHLVFELVRHEFADISMLPKLL
jgi:hypothetical protein